MKARVLEFSRSFEVDLTAETLEEAAALVRLQVNANKEVEYRQTTASTTGVFCLEVGFRKSPRSGSSIPKRI